MIAQASLKGEGLMAESCGTIRASFTRVQDLISIHRNDVHLVYCKMMTSAKLWSVVAARAAMEAAVIIIRFLISSTCAGTSIGTGICNLTPYSPPGPTVSKCEHFRRRPTFASSGPSSMKRSKNGGLSNVVCHLPESSSLNMLSVI